MQASGPLLFQVMEKGLKCSAQLQQANAEENTRDVEYSTLLLQRIFEKGSQNGEAVLIVSLSMA